LLLLLLLLVVLLQEVQTCGRQQAMPMRQAQRWTQSCNRSFTKA
jgi:hypothetical protein